MIHLYIERFSIILDLCHKFDQLLDQISDSILDAPEPTTTTTTITSDPTTITTTIASEPTTTTTTITSISSKILFCSWIYMYSFLINSVIQSISRTLR